MPSPGAIHCRAPAHSVTVLVCISDTGNSQRRQQHHIAEAMTDKTELTAGTIFHTEQVARRGALHCSA